MTLAPPPPHHPTVIFLLGKDEGKTKAEEEQRAPIPKEANRTKAKTGAEKASGGRAAVEEKETVQECYPSC